jgi:hypothetical protein
MRQAACDHAEPPPPPMSPTFRGVFSWLEGMHRVQVTRQGQVHELLEGLTAVQINLLRLFGNQGCRLDQISAG